MVETEMAEENTLGWGELIGAYTAMTMVGVSAVTLTALFLGYLNRGQAAMFLFASPFVGLAISLMVIERRMKHV